MKYFSEFGFRRSFLKVDIMLHGMESPVFALVGKGEAQSYQSYYYHLTPSFRR